MTNTNSNVSTPSLSDYPEGPVEKTDMTKVNYLLGRPGLLLEMLPADKREALSAHVGRRAMKTDILSITNRRR